MRYLPVTAYVSRSLRQADALCWMLNAVVHEMGTA